MRGTRGRDVVSRAIILRSQTMDEDDVLVDFLTPDLGKLWGRARHGRKSRKRFGTLLESFNILTLRFRDKGQTVDLEEATLEKPLLRLRESMERLSAAYYLVDLVREMVPERHHEGGLFDLLEKALLALEDGKDLRKILQVFEARFLEILGYAPQITDCLKCHRPRQEGGRFFFVYREGGIYCSDCVPSGPAHEEVQPTTLPAILSRFIEYQLGRSPKALKFLTVASQSAT